MPKTRHDFCQRSCFMIVLALVGFFVILFLALCSPVPRQLELHQQLVPIEPVGPTETSADSPLRGHQTRQ